MKMAAIASFVIGVVALGTGAIGERWYGRTTRLESIRVERHTGATIRVDTFSTPFLTIVGGGALAAGVVFLLIDSSRRRP